MPEAKYPFSSMGVYETFTLWFDDDFTYSTTVDHVINAAKSFANYHKVPFRIECIWNDEFRMIFRRIP